MHTENASSGGRFGEIREFIAAHGRFLLLTHIGPDGDGLLSCVALSRYLRSKGKQATVVTDGPCPLFVEPFDPDGLVRPHDALLETPDWADRFDAILVLDTGKPSRLGKLHRPLIESGLPVGVFDHHIREEGDFDGPAAIDSGAAAVGEIILDFLEEEGGGAFEDRVIVRTLLATLVYDTGQFRFSNTKPKTLRWAARLIEKGADQGEAYSIFWESNSAGSIKLLGHLMSNLNFDCGGRLAWFTLGQAVLDKYGVKRHETEEYISYPRSIASVEVVAYFTEIGKNLTRVSLRSKGRVVIHDVAQQFGGGGHAFASGARVAMGLEETGRAVARALTEKINATLGPGG